MSKLSDQIKAALDKKKGVKHPDAEDAPAVEKKAKKDLIIPEQDSFRWALEEYRVSLFAQQLKTAYPISVKRMDKLWDSRS